MFMTKENLEEVVTENDNVVIKWREEKTLSELRKYLSSDIFHDIGPIISKRIVSFFGLRTAQMIESALHEILQVKGVGRKRMLSVQNGWFYQKQLIKKSAELIKIKSVE